MLAIQKSHRHHGSCTPHVLPCRINHNGAVDVSKRYWNPTKGSDGKTTAYFRGRKLHARTLKVPKGYRGAVLVNTGKVLTSDSEAQVQIERQRHALIEEDVLVEDEDDEKEEEVKIVEESASFDAIMVWGHETVVDSAEDCYTRGLEEWIGFSESIHSYEQKEESK